MMKLSEIIALVALFFALAAVLASGRVLAQPDARAKALAAAAADDAALKRLQGEDARKLAEVQRVKAAQARKDALVRRCKIKAVMTDGEIEACRVAYREVGDTTR